MRTGVYLGLLTSRNGEAIEGRLVALCRAAGRGAENSGTIRLLVG